MVLFRSLFAAQFSRLRRSLKLHALLIPSILVLPSALITAQQHASWLYCCHVDMVLSCFVHSRFQTTCLTAVMLSRLHDSPPQALQNLHSLGAVTRMGVMFPSLLQTWTRAHERGLSSPRCGCPQSLARTACPLCTPRRSPCCRAGAP